MDVIQQFLLNESFLISSSPTIYNKSKIKENNIIMVIGLSGAGKTTLSKKLATSIKGEHISIDDFDELYLKKNNPNGKYDDLNDDDWDKKIHIPMRKLLLKQIKEKAKRGIVVLDGIQLVEPLDDIYGKEWKKKYCFIDMGTSMMKAAFRGIKQQGKLWVLKHPIRHFRHNFTGTNKFLEKQLKEFRVEMKRYGIEGELYNGIVIDKQRTT